MLFNFDFDEIPTVFPPEPPTVLTRAAEALLRYDGWYCEPTGQVWSHDSKTYCVSLGPGKIRVGAFCEASSAGIQCSGSPRSEDAREQVVLATDLAQAQGWL